MKLKYKNPNLTLLANSAGIRSPVMIPVEMGSDDYVATRGLNGPVIVA